MAETKLNLNYQVDSAQFENKVGDAIETGEASDEVQDKINAKFNTSGPTGGHTHSGAVLDGEKIDYTNLTNVPTSFNPSSHNHTFGEITGDISWSQLDSLVSGTGSAETLIRSDDSRLSDSRDPNPHSHPFTDLTGDIAFTQLDAIVSTGSESDKIIAANDARLSDARTPVSHDNTYHSETYITSSGVTYENLPANGDIGTASTQVSQGDHNHNDLYYVHSTINSLLSGKADVIHTHNNEDIQNGALADNASYKNPQKRYYSFPPFGFGGWSISGNGNATVNPSSSSSGDYVIPILSIPSDSIIKEFGIYLNTTDAHDLTISLMRTNLTNGIDDVIAQMTHTTESTGYALVSTTDFTSGMDMVDRQYYHYWVLLEEASTYDVDITVSGCYVACDVEKPLP